jgi:hypothetical protein
MVQFDVNRRFWHDEKITETNSKRAMIIHKVSLVSEAGSIRHTMGLDLGAAAIVHSHARKNVPRGALRAQDREIASTGRALLQRAARRSRRSSTKHAL